MKNPRGKKISDDQKMYNPLILFLILLAAANIFFAWSYSTRYHAGIDFYQQSWVVPAVLKKMNIANIWSREGKIQVGKEALKLAALSTATKKLKYVSNITHNFSNPSLGISATPFFFSVMSVFYKKNYTEAHENYVTFMIIIFVILIITLCRTLRFGIASTLVFIIFFLYWYQPTRSDLRVANVNIIQLGVITLFLYLQTKKENITIYFISGIILGLAGMFKPNLAFVIIMLCAAWLINRRFKKLLWIASGILCGMLIAFIISSIYFSSCKSWINFFSNMGHLANNPSEVKTGNFGFSSVITEWTGFSSSKFLLVFFSFLSFFFIWVGKISDSVSEKSRAERQLQEDFLTVSTGWTIILLSAPIVWLHYYVIIIPLILYLNRPGGIKKYSWSNPAVLRRLTSLIPVFLLGAAPMPMLWQPYDANIQSHLCVISGIIFIILCYWEFYDIRSIMNTKPGE